MKRLQRGWEKLQGLFVWIDNMHIPTHSTYTCFFLILSLFPCMLLLLGLLKYTPLGVEDLMNLLEGLLPEAFVPVARVLAEASYEHSSGTIVSLSAIAALWSASRGMMGLLNGLNAVHGYPEDRNFLHSRFISMIYTLLFLIVLVLTLVLHVFGNAIVDFLWMTTHPALMLLMNLIDFRFVLLLVLQVLLFTGMYALLPARRQRIRSCIPGALVASLGWLGSSKLFSIYVDYFAAYTNIFGSLYGLALAMLWLYFCISMIFYGAALNRLLTRRS